MIVPPFEGENKNKNNTQIIADEKKKEKKFCGLFWLNRYMYKKRERR